LGLAQTSPILGRSICEDQAATLGGCEFTSATDPSVLHILLSVKPRLGEGYDWVESDACHVGCRVNRRRGGRHHGPSRGLIPISDGARCARDPLASGPLPGTGAGCPAIRPLHINRLAPILARVLKWARGPEAGRGWRPPLKWPIQSQGSTSFTTLDAVLTRVMSVATVRGPDRASTTASLSHALPRRAWRVNASRHSSTDRRHDRRERAPPRASAPPSGSTIPLRELKKNGPSPLRRVGSARCAEELTHRRGKKPWTTRPIR
jgi:hypothetical protein